MIDAWATCSTDGSMPQTCPTRLQWTRYRQLWHSHVGRQPPTDCRSTGYQWLWAQLDLVVFLLPFAFWLFASLFGDCLHITDSSKTRNIQYEVASMAHIIVQEGWTAESFLLPGNFWWCPGRLWWGLPGILRASRPSLSAPTSGPP